ncbi:DNA replication and repair protein RecF [Achromobacter mucicolens]|nr:DNA replication and repair protein RecF [Achromobacter mucicolens]
MTPSLETSNLPTTLRRVLQIQLRTAEFREETLHVDHVPALIMLNGHSVVAFATGGQQDYEVLYAAFKKLFLKNSEEWSAKDVSFVFCLPPGASVDESFCSRVEVDVYFCRKYVIQLVKDVHISLARLPFLPLTPVSGTASRPPTAQTLLAQRDMRPALAAALVVPARMSAESILNASLEGKYGSPHRVEGTAAVLEAELVEERVQATLQSISIQNFRAYREKKEFALGAAITVLYGPNGFGKTSFFDAVDFVATGGVLRLNKSNSSLDAAARHLDSTVHEDAVVSLTVERAGTQYVISRNLADPANATVNGKPANRKDVLSLLTGGVTNPSDRLENMVALFRATHLFSQDSQELTQDVAEKCELPSDIVSRMLAFEDYVGGLKKTNDVLKLARQRISQAKARAEQAAATATADRIEIDRLEKLASTSSSATQLDARFRDLELALESSGFDTTSLRMRDTRGTRAMLNSAAAEAGSEQMAAGKALERFIRLQDLNQKRESLQARIKDLKVELLTADTEASESAAQVVALSSELAEKRQAAKSAQNARDRLQWSVLMLPEYSRLSTAVSASGRALAKLTAERDEQADVKRRTDRVKQAATADVEAKQKAQKLASLARSEIENLVNRHAEWKTFAPRYQTLAPIISKLADAIETYRSQIEKMKLAEKEQQLVISRIEHKLRTAQEKDSSLKSLISNLRTHIDGSVCILCGHDHGSEAALLDAIDGRLQLSETLIEISNVRSAEMAKLEALRLRRQNASDAIARETLKLQDAQNERDGLEHRWTVVEASLRDRGLDPAGDTTEPLASHSHELLAEESAATNATSAAKKALADAEQAAKDASQILDAIEQKRRTVAEALDASRNQLDKLLAEAHRRAVNFDLGVAALYDAQLKADAQLTKALEELEVSNNALEMAKISDAAVKARLAQTQRQEQLDFKAWNSWQLERQHLTVEQQNAGYNGVSSEDEIRSLIRAASARVAIASDLSRRVAEIEVALDTAATSAAFDNLRQRIAANRKIIHEAQAEIAQIEPWTKYFAEIAKLLDEQQALATNLFINEYGPRTAVIQQRLRPVYGFGDIDVSSNGSRIGISVNRKGADLRPTDYFSQSQVQTLVLGLFLTACSSQTWSGFSSIMMDDPVTHFDDLNTYALLDLIAGLQTSPEGARQFVISTCDEKLLQLARQKFRHLGGKAKFYRFQAIGAGGPVVSEIPA